MNQIRTCRRRLSSTIVSARHRMIGNNIYADVEVRSEHLIRIPVRTFFGKKDEVRDLIFYF